MNHTKFDLTLLKWMVEGAHIPNGQVYHGSMVAARENEALLCQWNIFNEAPIYYTGYGFMIHGYFIASRAPAMLQPDNNTSVGLVIYDIRMDGTLPARWYHPTLNGKIGRGISTKGPVDTLVGRYVADYETAANARFDTLIKNITIGGDVYTIEWLLGEKVLYRGVGMRFGDHLVVGWAVPGIPVEIIKYDCEMICGKPNFPGCWTRIGETRICQETLIYL